MERLYRYSRQLLSAGFLCSTGLLLFNDFFLKQYYPCWLTGKLSDVAGLFAFPFFLAALFPRRKKLMYVFTAIGFILWKLPITDPLVESWNKIMPYSVGRVKDYTDYLALAILPFSYYYRPKVFITTQYTQINRALSMSVLALASFAFMATAGTHGNIKKYPFNVNQGSVAQSIDRLLQQHPELIVPDSLARYTNHPDPSDTTGSNNNGISEFSFYIPEHNLIIWSRFSQPADGLRNESELTLIGYTTPNERWKFDQDISRKERRMIISLFEERIINQLDVVPE